mgnify:FL=1
MITKTVPLSMTESIQYLGEEKDSEVEFKKFTKKFISIKPNEAKEMRKKLEELNLLKMKSENLIKIIDIMPDDIEGLNKIFNDVSLDEDETKKILEIINKYK